MNLFGSGERVPTIKLLSKHATSTSRGILSKAWYLIDGKPYMVKGNSVDLRGVPGYEPYSEVMASRISKLLEIEYLNYSLMEASLFSHVTVTDIKHVSVCPYNGYGGTRRVSLEDYANNVLERSPDGDEYLNICRSVSNVELFWKTLALDALIGNPDRHTYNIELFVSEEVTKFTPVFDNGAGLLAWVSESELTAASLVGRYDKAKPFRTTHSKQMKLLPKGLFPDMDLDKLYNDIVDEITPILDLLPEKRSKAIKTYIKGRMRYIEGVILR